MIAFLDSDYINYRIIITNDGGDSWTRVDPENLPVNRISEGTHPNNGLCLETWGDSLAWIAIGEVIIMVLPASSAPKIADILRSPSIQRYPGGIQMELEQ